MNHGRDSMKVGGCQGEQALDKTGEVAGRGYRAAVNSAGTTSGAARSEREGGRRNGEPGPGKSHGRSPVPPRHRGAIVCATKVGCVPATGTEYPVRSIYWYRCLPFVLPMYGEQVTDQHSTSPNKIRGLRWLPYDVSL
ncbi:hypothetical protein HN011_011116 [Eciton burchellii]|nr:hypothetical protein HN011_011116 [Eciton burchellii]